ncbi:MAG: lactate utilization protein [Deltaproteobacteria bacterium]|jgi:hypothetical protein|nr:lactate utilization protein [Deltaproteobacteria bacterium]
MSGKTALVPLEKVWELRLAETAKSLEDNGFAATVHTDMAAAMDYFKNTLLPEVKPASVGVGGSETVRLSGFYEYINSRKDIVFNNPYAPGLTPEQGIAMRRQGLISDLFVTSTNALLRDGRLLNLDGFGNRVAAMCFGPSKVVIFAGRNKIVDDLDAGVAHIRGFAAPGNNIRLNKTNPCTKTGSCMDCKSSGRVCNYWVLTERCFPAKKIHVLLINEDHGY